VIIDSKGYDAPHIVKNIYNDIKDDINEAYLFTANNCHSYDKFDIKPINDFSEIVNKCIIDKTKNRLIVIDKCYDKINMQSIQRLFNERIFNDISCTITIIIVERSLYDRPSEIRNMINHYFIDYEPKIEEHYILYKDLFSNLITFEEFLEQMKSLKGMPYTFLLLSRRDRINNLSLITANTSYV
jgi:hypothetical protein